MESSLIIAMVVSYIVGSVVSFFLGRKMGIQIGSMLTFDLFVRLGYVKYHTDGQGEIVLEKIGPGSGD